MIDTGLVIASPWIQKVLAGEKIWEIRSKPNARTGRIALCQKGGPIVGTCLIEVSVQITPSEFAKHFDKHRVPAEVLRQFYGDKVVYAWPLSAVRRLDKPIHYKHPGGGSWVKLSAGNVADFQKLQSA